MIKLLKKVKSFFIYKLILYFFFHIYNFIWSYIINFKAKFLYFLWKKNKDSYDIGSQPRIVYDNKECKKLAAEIYNFYIENPDLKKKITNNNTNENYSSQKKVNIISVLDEKIKRNILNFAISDKIITTVNNYLKIFPTICKINLIESSPTNKPEGPAQWHRDDFGFKSLDLFINISEINEDNGPLFAFFFPNNIGVFSAIRGEEYRDTRKGDRNKILDETFMSQTEKIKNTNLIKLEGEPGNIMFIDSFNVYHKGGFCKKNKRLMLRISYQSKDSANLREIGESDEFKKYIKDIKKTIFSKHLLENKINPLQKKINLFLTNKIYKYLRTYL